MIRYDYSCPDCDAETEVRHSIMSDPEIRCGCGGRMRRSPGLGSGICVAGGKSVSRTFHARQMKESGDMEHARNVQQLIKTELQPRTRSGPLARPGPLHGRTN